MPLRRLVIGSLLALAAAAPASARVSPPLAAGHGDRMVVAWTQDGEGGSSVRLADASAGGGIKAPQTVATAASGTLGLEGVGRSAEGDVLVVWSRNPGQPPEGGPPRPVVEAALRPAGGVFGPVQTLSAGSADHLAPVVVHMGESGHGVVAWRQDGRMRVAARPPGGGFAEVPAPQLGVALAIASASDGEAVVAGGTDRFATSLRPPGGDFGPPAPFGSDMPTEGRETVAMGPRGDALAVAGRHHPPAVLVSRRPRGEGFGAEEVLDSGWLGSAGAGVSEAGESVAAWSRAPGAGGGVFATFARPGEPFAAPQRLDAGDTSSVQLGVAGDGSAIAAWSARGLGVRLARRTPGEGFGAPVTVHADQDGAWGLSLATGGRDALLAWWEEDGPTTRAVAATVPASGPPVVRTLAEATDTTYAAPVPAARIPRQMRAVARRGRKVLVPIACEVVCAGTATARARGRSRRVAFSLRDRLGTYVHLPVARGARRVEVVLRTGGRLTDRRALRVRRTAAPRCPRVPWARVLDRRAGTVVFEQAAGEGTGRVQAMACRAPDGVARSLLTTGEEDLGSDRVTRARAGARSVAFVIEYGSRFNGSSVRLALHDVRTGRALGGGVVGGANAFDPYPPVVEVHDLLVSRGGAAVAVVQAGAAISVRALLRTGERVTLDPGGADPGSLRVGGGKAEWRHGGEARSATLP